MKNDYRQKIDVVVILGGGISADGMLSSATRERLDYFLKSGIGERVPIILSGRWSGFKTINPPTTEAKEMKKYLVERGVDERRIILEMESLDTISNAVFVKKIIERHRNWKKILLVTSDWHMKRALWIFQQVLGENYQLTSLPARSDKAEKKQREDYERYLLNIAKRFLGDIRGNSKAFIQLLMDEHPFYSKSEKAQKLLKGIAIHKKQISP